MLPEPNPTRDYITYAENGCLPVSVRTWPYGFRAVAVPVCLPGLDALKEMRRLRVGPQVPTSEIEGIYDKSGSEERFEGSSW
jgi:hypothetical protein